MKTKDKTERAAAARARLEAKAALPAGPCRLCGVTVPAGSGLIVSDPWAPKSQFEVAVQVRAQRVADGLPAFRWPWDRQHAHCVPDNAAIIKAILGISLTPREAAAVAVRGVVPVAFRVEREARRRPYDFVTEDERRELRAVVDEVLGEHRPSRCTDGACGLCGRSHSIGWTASALRWSDGTPAPFCRDCARLWAIAGDPTGIEDIRLIGLRGLTKLWDMGSPDFGFRAFAEVARPDERAGYDEPWTYRETLRKVEERVWTSRPDLAPDQLQEHYRNRAREEALEYQRERQERELAFASVSKPWLTDEWA